MSHIRQSEPALLDAARALRHDPTPCEKLLWSRLRARGLSGFKFRRQHPLPPYVVDFYCPRAKLAIELDGDSHGRERTRIYDANRDAVLGARGVRVLRFANSDVVEDVEAVLCTILNAVTASLARR